MPYVELSENARRNIHHARFSRWKSLTKASKALRVSSQTLRRMEAMREKDGLPFDPSLTSPLPAKFHERIVLLVLAGLDMPLARADMPHSEFVEYWDKAERWRFQVRENEQAGEAARQAQPHRRAWRWVKGLFG